MQQSPFQKVSEAAQAIPEIILQEEGIEHKKQGKGFTLRNEWNHGFICAVNCGDTSGSASFTRELFFHCHQCGAKHDLFDWLAKRNGTDAWSECKRLAERLNVDLRTKRLPGGRTMPKRMTSDILETAIHDLLESDHAGQARSFLRDRKLLAPRALAELGVGYIKGYIVFAQFGPKGEVLERYRGYTPGGEPPWRWFGAGSGGPGVWPAQRAPGDEDNVLLLEGEWDVLTALIRLRLHRQGFTPCTFTSGAGSHPPAAAIPKWFGGREVHVAYDNDTFQGTDYSAYVAVAKPGKKLENAVLAMEQRRSNLIERVVPLIEELGSTPVLRLCPIAPGDKWGADLRDWVDAGGRDLIEWKEFRSIPPLRSNVEEVPFDECFGLIGRRVKTVVQVNTLSEDDVVIPRTVKLDCPMGTVPACAQCAAVRLFPDRVISLADYPEIAARAVLPNAEKNYIIKQVVAPPRGCPKANISMIETITGSSWSAVRPATNLEEEANRQIHVISDEPPSLTGNVEIIGDVYSDPDTNRAFIRVDTTRSLDKAEVDLRPHLNDFMMRCPHRATKLAEIDDYLEERWRDLTANVTRIHGRRDVFIAHELLMHSALEIRMQRSTPQRGWLDVTVIGNTRSGKTATFEHLLRHHGLGTIHSAVANTSRAGLVMGTNMKGVLRPGLFPRCHRKALIIDEWHYLVSTCKTNNPASWIQTARDSGYSDSLKISGNRKLPTKVRFATIANWANGDRKSHQFDCQHLIDLYDTPEAIARLDFAIVVGDPPSEHTIPEVEHFWTSERTRTLIMRAWAMTADHVHLDDGVMELATLAVAEWDGRYDTSTVPLFTVEEKHLSILRIAAAVANVCFSHPPGKPAECLVREVHVRWAIEWLKQTWDLNGYSEFSEAEMRKENLTNPFFAERLLTVALGFDRPDSVSMLGDLFSGFSAQEAPAIVGKDINEALRWLNQARKTNIFKIARNRQGERGRRYVPTRGGAELMQAILRTADEDPDHYVDRYRALSNWFTTADATSAAPSGLEALGGTDRGQVPF